MEPVGAPPIQARRLVTRSIPLADVRPEALLRLDSASPRGFWARGGAWVAHVGATATIRIDRSTDSHPYETVWRHAAAIRQPGGSDLHASRFYGGFAFREDHRPSGMWDGFPAGLFVMPALELAGGSRGTELRAQAVLEDWQDPAKIEALLDARLEEASVRLKATSSPDRAPDSTAGGSVARAEPAPGDRAIWNQVVTDALDAIDSGRVSKVVLARTLDVRPDRALDPVDVVLALWSENPRAHVYLFEPRPGAVLVGAAPETVATVYGRDFHATAVAGSVPRGESPEETSALAMRLLSSDKDLLEHRFAVEDMVARLEGIAEEVGSEWEPHVITLSRIQHLETRIRARLPEGCTVLSALEALHPTPAVCGLPRDAALAFIHDEEPFDRGWYAGPVGWFDLDGSGVFAPALRTAVGQSGTWRLFAGAGIVAGSQPSLEWEETGIKFEPVLRALAASERA